MAVHEPTCGLLVAEGPTGELSYLYGVPGRQYGTWVFREHNLSLCTLLIARLLVFC